MDSEEEDEDLRRSSAALSSPPGKSSIGGRSRTAEADSDSEVEDETATDVNTQFLHSSNSFSSSARSMKHKARSTGDGPPPAKKKRVVSEPNSDDDYEHEGMAVPSADDDDDDNAMFESKRNPIVGKTKGKSVKGKGTAKLRRDSVEVSPVIGTKRPRVGQTSKLEDTIIDVTGDIDPTPDTSTARSPSQPKDPSPPPTKRRKLPTIKKNKGTGAVSATVSATGSKPSLAGITKGGIPVLPEGKPTGVRKTAATVGNADFDLRNASVYRELFKTVFSA